MLRTVLDIKLAVKHQKILLAMEMNMCFCWGILWGTEL